MQERGRVITVRDGAVDVRMEAPADCGGCSACARATSGETIMHGVRDSFGATVGDTVEVVIPDTIRSRAAMAVFVVPVACMLLGYLAGFLLGTATGSSPDVFGIVGALLAVNIAVLGIRLAERKLAADEQFVPKVNAILSRGHDPYCM